MGTIIGSGLELYIKRDARDTALNKVAEAEKRAQEIMEQAQQRIEMMRRETADNTLLRIEQNTRRLLAQADLSAKQLWLDRRAEVMRRVWAQVESNLNADMPAPQRLDLIANGLADAAEQLGGGDLVLQLNAQDAPLVGDEQITQWMASLAEAGVTSLTVDSEPAAIWGGVIVRRQDTRQLVDNSWNERMALAQRTLQNAVYHRLTPSAPAENKNA